ncbi:MAG: hypothetical protein EA419_04005 [Wenzhouxiangella sp.]|nr:MAG: hypothetical protein EA419_04005 [Wenzhouxiangella sp.]
MRRLIILFSALLLVACDRNSAPEPPANDVASAQPPVQNSVPADPALTAELLARIDADTAKLWLSLEPMPEALLEQIWSQMATLGDLQEEAYEDIAETIDHPVIRALLTELGQLDSPEAYAERGIDINGLAGIHLVSVFPLLHWQLTDQEAFAAMLARIESESETPLPRRQIGEEEIVWLELDRVGLAIHHDAHFVTIGLVPEREELLRRVANLDRASPGLERAEVDTFARDRGLRQDSFGFIDFERLTGLLLDGEDEFLVQLRADTPLGQAAEDASCRTELGQLTRLFPRKSYGTTELSAETLSMKLTLETDSELGESLAALADSPVSLASQRTGLAYMGVALNIVAARDFGRSVVGGWVENPPQCFLFSNIAENAAEWQLALNRPIPPLVTNLHGARIHLSQVEMDDGELADVAGTLAVFMRNPQMMIGMAQMFSPELAALDLRPGADPQPVPSELIPQLEDMPAWIGLSEGGLGLAVGEGQDAALPAALRAGTADSAVWSTGFDLAGYVELMEAGMGALAVRTGADENFDSSEATAGWRILAEIYRYMHQSLHLTTEGIELQIRFDLAD